MKPGALLKSFVIPITGILLFASFSNALDKPIERKGRTPAGEVVFVSGRAEVRLVPEENYRPAAPRQELVPGDIVKTASGGRLSILFKDETQLKLASNTTLMIKEVTSHAEKPGALRILLKLESGEVWTRSKGASEGLTIETPHATAAIRGTEWGLSVIDNESRVIVMEGNVQLSSPLGSIHVGRNEQAIVTGREAPVKSLVVMPRDRTQWTHYLTEKRLIGYLKFRGGILGRAETLFNEGRLEESAEVFERILSTEPANALALTGLGLIELKRGKVEKAGEYLDQSLEAKKRLLALLGKSYLFISGNRTDEAGEILKDAKESFSKDPLPYIFSSYLYTFHGDFPGALDECDRGLSAIPNDPLLLGFKVNLYFILDKPAEAKKTIDTLIGKNPESSEGYEKLGFYERMVTGNSKKAKQALQRSIDLDGLNDEAVAKLADLLREEGYIPEALKLIEHALSIAPWNAMHHYNYGRLLADINRIDEAREEFRKALGLDSTFSRAYLGEGIVLLKEGRTEQALKELSKASLFEPNLSEIHSFLAIAYYQRQEVRAALDELRRAEECDPLDSTPHQLASVIYNDLYMPVEAIEEARKVLDLLPYRKASGEALLESSQNGTMAVNYGLDFLDLPEWSLYYAQKALFIDPYRNTSHIGVAKAYRKLGQVSALQGFNEFTNPFLSEQLQGLTLNVNSLNFSNRYSTLISKPGHYLTAGGTYAWGDSTEAQGDVTATGDFGSRFPLTYWFYSKGYRDSGHLPNNPYKEADGNLILGYKPSDDHDIYLDLAYSRQKVGVPPSASVPAILHRDDDENLKEDLYWVQLGYHKRFSPVSHLIAELRYFKSNDKIENPDFETDHTGFTSRRNKFENAAWGIRHMLTPYEDHQASYGMDYNHLKLNMIDRWGMQEARDSLGRESFILYIYDRWTISPGMTLDAGLFLSYYDAEADLVYRATKQSIIRPYHKEIFNRVSLISIRGWASPSILARAGS